MKRTCSLLRLGAVLLCGVLAACSGELLDAGEASENPYHEEAQTLFAGLMDHTISFADGYRGTHTDPGLILLEAIDAYAPLAIDFDVEALSNAFLAARDTDRKKPAAGPFDSDQTLTHVQKRHLNRLLDRAGDTVSLGHMRSVLDEVEAAAARELGPEAIKPIYVVSAFLQAQVAFVSDESNQPSLRRLAAVLQDSAPRRSSAAPRIIAIQMTDSLDAPPTWSEHFRPGAFISQTLSDVRTWAQTAGIVGAGIGCGVGLVATAFGCAAGGAGGAFLGGTGGAVVGIFVSTVANLMDEIRDFQGDVSQWCEDQSRLNSALRHRDYSNTCERDQQ